MEVEIRVLRRIFDPEERKVTLEIYVGEPYNTTVYKTGSLGRIAFQLAEQFSLSLAPKDLAEVLKASAEEATFEIEKEAQLYIDFHSWFTENLAALIKENKAFYAENPTPCVRLTEDALTRFFHANGIALLNRGSVLSYWREKGWLHTNESDPRRFKKRVKFKAEDGTTRLLRLYEIELRYEQFTKEAEDLDSALY